MAFVNHLTNTKVPMGLMYLGASITLFGWWAVQHQQESIVNTQRLADLRATEQLIYSQQVQAWAKASADYTLCLDGVARADLNRLQWADIADGLESIGATEFAERVRNGPVLSSPPRTEDDCHAPGPAPVSPALDGANLTDESPEP